MYSTSLSPSLNLLPDRGKDTDYQGQTERVFAVFAVKPSTMLMVSKETGIERANICRFISLWQKQNRVWLLRFNLCQISKHKAGYYTTDPTLFPSKQQINLI